MSLENSRGRESVALRTERIRAPGGHEAHFMPNRGGIIPSLKLYGKEVLYLDKETLLDTNKNVRGGIPILFPNAGPLDNPLYPNLKRHGFARTSSEWTYSTSPDRSNFVESLVSSEESLRQYPFKYIFDVSGSFVGNTFGLTQEVTNLEEVKEMPVAFGLHPYFKVLNQDKQRIRFEFAGGKEFEERKEEWMAGDAVFIDNPKKYALNAEIACVIPGLGKLLLEASSGYEKIGVWTEPGKDFVCIEPWMRESGGLIDNPQLVAPGKSYALEFTIRVEKS